MNYCKLAKAQWAFTGPAFSRLDRLLPIRPALHLRKLIVYRSSLSSAGAGPTVFLKHGASC